MIRIDSCSACHYLAALLLLLAVPQAHGEAAPPGSAAEPGERPAVALALKPAGSEGERRPPSVEVSGFVDVYYAYNFNRPPSFLRGPGGARIRNDIENKLRNFDFKHNEFALNLAEVVIQRAPAPVGFRLDLNFGKAAEWIHLAEPGDRDTYEHIQQAYLTAPLKLGRRTGTLDIGKFVTHHGAEVIETKDNWNYSRSLLFAWAIPYYHMGLRYRLPFNEGSAITLHIYNGWNNVEDNNDALSYGVMYSRNLGRKLAFTFNWTGGPELENDDRHWRHLFDTVLTYAVTPKTALVLNFDYARESQPGGEAAWIGLAGYARHAFDDRNAVALRVEWFDDRDGATTGTAQSLKEFTLTFDRKHSDNLLTRAEFRYDWSNREVFDQRTGTSKRQPTLLVGAVYLF